jgi:thiamine-phosphate pyrophosphorylase
VTSELSPETFRIIDANLDRLGEGLRVLEEISRFLLNNTLLTKQLKKMRHELVVTDPSLQVELISKRKPRSDVGRKIETPDQSIPRNMLQVITANAKRCQESLRVLEELSTLPGISLDTKAFKRNRFILYRIEQELATLLFRRRMISNLSGLYLKIESQRYNDLTEESINQALRIGVRTVELDITGQNKSELLKQAIRLKDMCHKNNSLLLISDHLDLVLASDADGLRLTDKEYLGKSARWLLPTGKLLGISVSCKDEAIEAEKQAADYLYVSGLDLLREITAHTKLPIVAEVVLPSQLDAAYDTSVKSLVLDSLSFEKSLAHIIIERFNLNDR